MTLNRVSYPGPSAQTLWIAHGLYGSARNWNVVAKHLSSNRTVSAIDMRNHAHSPHFDTHNYFDLASDLSQIIPEGSDLLGHSMGGKSAMVMALQNPHQLRRLIVADIAPVAYSHSQLSMIEAMESVDLSSVEKRSDADRQLAEYVDDPTVRAFLIQSLDTKEKKWRLNLPVLRKEMSQIVGFPEVDGAFDGPTLFLSGAESDYVRPEHRDRIKSLFPKAVFAKIPGAGHWLHAERPRAFVQAVEYFLSA